MWQSYNKIFVCQNFFVILYEFLNDFVKIVFGTIFDALQKTL